MNYKRRTPFEMHAGTNIPAIKGTGVSVSLVLDELARGKTIDHVAERLDITRGDVLDCLAAACELFSSERDWNLDEIHDGLWMYWFTRAWDS